MDTILETEFFGTSETFLITVTYDPPTGSGIRDEKRDVRRFVFWDEREYNRKRLDLLETKGIESIYCVKNCITTVLSSRRNKKI